MYLLPDELDTVLENRKPKDAIEYKILSENSTRVRDKYSIAVAKYYETAVLLGLDVVTPFSQGQFNIDELTPEKVDLLKTAVVNHLMNNNKNFSTALDRTLPLNAEVKMPTLQEEEVLLELMKAHLDTGVFSGFAEINNRTDASKRAFLRLAEKITPLLDGMSTSKEHSMALSKCICSISEDVVSEQIFGDGNHRTAINLYYSLHSLYVEKVPRNKAEEVHACLTLVRCANDRFGRTSSTAAYGRLFGLTRFFPYEKNMEQRHNLNDEHLGQKRMEIEKLEATLKHLAKIGSVLQQKQRNGFFVTSSVEKANRKKGSHVVSPADKSAYKRWQHARANTGTQEIADVKLNTAEVDALIKKIENFDETAAPKSRGFKYKLLAFKSKETTKEQSDDASNTPSTT